jgi:uncharacterized protein (DUF302 family)
MKPVTRLSYIVFIGIFLGTNLNLFASQGNKNTDFYFSKEVKGSYDQVLSKLKTALTQVEFGVVSEMMMSNTLNEKAGANMDTYAIIGVCNPKFALKALQLEENLGLMLPCKAIIRKTDDDTFVVAFQNPKVIMSVIGNEELTGLASEVSERLKIALDNI